MAEPTIEDARADLNNRCDAIEEAYEFMLAYASQGLADEQGGTGSQIRGYLRRFDAALTGLADVMTGYVQSLAIEPAGPYHRFIAVVTRDAQDSQAALGLALAQPTISSQLVDNLNASIHLRAVLTDLFLIDEILKTHLR